jgi:hypothetical protein
MRNLCQPSLMPCVQVSAHTPFERRPSVNNTLLASSTCTPKRSSERAREGSLPAHPVGTDRKRWHFYLSELDNWLRSQVITGGDSRHSGVASHAAFRK